MRQSVVVGAVADGHGSVVAANRLWLECDTHLLSRVQWNVTECGCEGEAVVGAFKGEREGHLPSIGEGYLARATVLVGARVECD